MSLTINTNIASLNAQRNLANSQNSLNVSLQRLSTGLRINSARDDAAGLAISERFTAQIRGLGQAVRNANDGISLVQTAEGAMGESVNALHRIRELAVQSANSTNSSSDRQTLNVEVQQLISEVDRIATQTTFNNNKILASTGGFSATFQIGGNVGETVGVNITASRSTDLGVSSNFSNISSENDATFATRLRTQFVGALSSSTLNGATLTDVATNQNSINKVNSVNNSSSGASAFIYGNSLVGTANTANGAGATNSGDIVVNGVEIGSTAGGTVAQVVAAINLKTAEHGVIADAAAGGTLALFNRDGSSINLTVKSADAAAATGFTNGTTSTVAAGANGAIVMNHDLSVGALNVNATATAGALEGSTTDTSIGLTSVSLASVDINTQAGANIAMLVSDRAIDTINNNRSTLGAVQNRLDSTIAALNSTVENLSSSRSRIQDADFAAETAMLSKAQILQQAGISILSQANALSQNALSLLQN